MTEKYPNTDQNPNNEPLRKEALLTEYRQMRGEIRSVQSLAHKRIIQGIAAIGAIIGYSLVSPEGLIYITTVPIIMAILFLFSIQAIIHLMFFGRHVLDIEDSIEVEHFGWENKYGGFLQSNKRHIPWSQWEQINLVNLPILIIHLITGITYIMFIAISLYTIESTLSQQINGFDPTLFAGGGYLILSILMVVAVFSAISVRKSLQPNDEDGS